MLRALTSFHAQRFIAAGDLVDDDDPVVAGREHLFEEASVTNRPIEQATAEPGEKRAAALPTAKAILETVGADPVAAQAALDAEQAAEKPRISLVAKLEKVIAEAPRCEEPSGWTDADDQPVPCVLPAGHADEHQVELDATGSTDPAGV
jgi:hypothetical protein